MFQAKAKLLSVNILDILFKNAGSRQFDFLSFLFFLHMSQESFTDL